MRSKLLLALAAAGLVVAAGSAGAQTVPPVGRPLDRQLVLAHRGASFEAPEHTFPAYDEAVADDADFLECDLQLTKDGVLVCVHDTTVNRTSNGTGRVDSFTLAELRALDFGSWFNRANPSRARAEYVGLKIVPFEEQLDCYLGLNPNLRFHVETKAPSEYAGRLEPALVALLRRKALLATGGPNDSTILVQSFEESSLRRIKELAPTLPTALLFGLALPPPDGSLPPSADISAPNFAYLLADPTYVTRAHAQGHLVHTYTVDDATQMRVLLEQGVDGIFTNRPDVLRPLIDARGTGVPAAERRNPARGFPTGCPGVAGRVTSPDGPGAVIPEAPLAALLPVVALGLVGVAVVVVRRRGVRSAA